MNRSAAALYHYLYSSCLKRHLLDTTAVPYHPPLPPQSTNFQRNLLAPVGFHNLVELGAGVWQQVFEAPSHELVEIVRVLHEVIAQKLPNALREFNKTAPQAPGHREYNGW